MARQFRYIEPREVGEDVRGRGGGLGSARRGAGGRLAALFCREEFLLFAAHFERLRYTCSQYIHSFRFISGVL